MSTATALVVDDEPMVRHLVRRILEPDVCGVLDVETGEAALRLIQQRPESIDVVLTDLAMPGIDGFDVVDVLTRFRPDLPVVCMSGYANQLSASRRLAVPFVQKPFTTEALLGAVAPLIERSKALRPSARAEQRQAADERSSSGLPRSRIDANVAEAVDLVAAARALRASRANPAMQG
jgi:DNA-binding NtrC family response regulator